MITISKKHPEREKGRSIVYVDGHGLPYHGRITEVRPDTDNGNKSWQVTVEYSQMDKMTPGGLLLVDNLMASSGHSKKRSFKRTYSEHCTNLWPNLKQYLKHALCEYVGYSVAKGRCPALHQKLLDMLDRMSSITNRKAAAWDARMRKCAAKSLEWFREHGVKVSENKTWRQACVKGVYGYNWHMKDAQTVGLEPYDVSVNILWVLSTARGWTCKATGGFCEGRAADPVGALKIVCDKLQADGRADEADMLREKFGLADYKPEDWRFVDKGGAACSTN